jgi:energy-coupling factor transporter ATP-binding protein EcfA2
VAIFRLEHLLHRAPFKLSGGEKKRVAFAAALAAKPKILVLDEPTAGQDSSFRQALIQCLHRLAGQGAAVLVVTHALNFLESLTSRWLIMAGGLLIADATPQDIMADEYLMQRAGLMPTEAFQWKQLKANVA